MFSTAWARMPTIRCPKIGRDKFSKLFVLTLVFLSSQFTMTMKQLLILPLLLCAFAAFGQKYNQQFLQQNGNIIVVPLNKVAKVFPTEAGGSALICGSPVRNITIDQSVSEVIDSSHGVIVALEEMYVQYYDTTFRTIGVSRANIWQATPLPLDRTQVRSNDPNVSFIINAPIAEVADSLCIQVAGSGGGGGGGGGIYDPGSGATPSDILARLTDQSALWTGNSEDGWSTTIRSNVSSAPGIVNDAAGYLSIYTTSSGFVNSGMTFSPEEGQINLYSGDGSQSSLIASSAGGVDISATDGPPNSFTLTNAGTNFNLPQGADFIINNTVDCKFNVKYATDFGANPTPALYVNNANGYTEVRSPINGDSWQSRLLVGGEINPSTGGIENYNNGSAVFYARQNDTITSPQSYLMLDAEEGRGTMGTFNVDQSVQNRFETNSSYTQIVTSTPDGTQNFTISATGATFTDGGDGQGIQYAGDYSTDYTDRSLTDAGYVKSGRFESYNRITSTSSPVTASTTLRDNLVDQGGTQASFTFNLPALPASGRVVQFTFNNTVTTLTIDGNGNTITGAPATTASAGTCLRYKYYGSPVSKWIRQQ